MKKLIFIALSIILLTQYSCKKVQPDMNSIDCSCAKETSADFDIEEIGGYGLWYEKRSITDSTFKEMNVIFTAKDTNASYKWYIGTEVLNSRSVLRYFNSSLVWQTIPITLVVRKTPNKICLPFDDGYDSITKTFVVTNRDYESSFLEPNPTLEGVYRMKEANGNDSVEITINMFRTTSNRVEVTNFDGNGNNLPYTQSEIVGCFYRQMWWDQNKFNLMLYHKTNGEAILTLDPKPLIEAPTYHYKGRKIQ
ncbi:MAG: hypothetical protein K9G29_08135 [Crocinitomicaceae bacterium]|jgi:hypothetical protein|nr:hypothetical protein [Crocinitomicaceae bacterium]